LFPSRPLAKAAEKRWSRRPFLYGAAAAWNFDRRCGFADRRRAGRSILKSLLALANSFVAPPDDRAAAAAGSISSATGEIIPSGVTSN